MADNPGQLGERHIIGPGTDVLDGVFLGRSAIVVDFDETPVPYEFAYSMLEADLTGDWQDNPLLIARAAIEAARDVIPFSPQKVRGTLRAEADARGIGRVDTRHEIPLSRFIGGGTCHHQTLFGGSLLQLLEERHGLGSRISVEPPEPPRPESRGHVWARYAHGEEDIVLDFSNNQAIRLEKPIKPRDRIYLRPEEIREYVAEEDLTPDDMLRLARYVLQEQHPSLRDESAAVPN